MCACVCMCVCVRACVRACVRVFVHACVHGGGVWSRRAVTYTIKYLSRRKKCWTIIAFALLLPFFSLKSTTRPRRMDCARNMKRMSNTFLSWENYLLSNTTTTTIMEEELESYGLYQITTAPETTRHENFRQTHTHACFTSIYSRERQF